MISDTDWDLLNKRLESIERSIDILRAVFGNPAGAAKFVTVDKQGNEFYVLKEGSLSDAGTVQVWNSNHKLVDCISTTKLEE